jgi:hypothetical protein
MLPGVRAEAHPSVAITGGSSTVVRMPGSAAQTTFDYRLEGAPTDVAGGPLDDAELIGSGFLHGVAPRSGKRMARWADSGG